LAPEARADAGAMLRVCLEPEPPPWSYWARDAQGNKTKELTGFSVELMRKVFERAGLKIKFEGSLPWARCIRSVSWGEIDFAMEMYYTDERARTFAFSHSYNTLTPQIYFLKSLPVTANKPADLKRYRGCGVRDVSYQHYGVNSKDLDLSVDVETAVYKLKGGKCDYFLEELEELEGYRLMGKDFASDPALASAPAPWAQPPTSHLVARRNSPAAALMPRIDLAIDQMISSGEAARLWARFSSAASYRP